MQLDWLQKNQLKKGLDTSNRLLGVDYIANELGHSNNNQSYRDKIKEKLERKFERIKHPFPRKKVVPLLGSPKIPQFEEESDNRWEPDTKEAFEQFKSQRQKKMLSPPLVQTFERPLRQQMKSQLDEQLKEIPSQKLALITKVVDGSQAFGSQHGSSVLSSQPDLHRNQSIGSIDPKQHLTKAEINALALKYNLGTDQVYEASSEFHAMSYGEPHLTFEMFFGQHALFRNKHPEMQRSMLTAMGL